MVARRLLGFLPQMLVHFRIEHAFGKRLLQIVQQAIGLEYRYRVTAGEIFDVAVDICRSSPAFGKWVGFQLSASNKRIVWIPPGFAHGFLVISDDVEFLYKTTDQYAPEFERTIAWNDPDLAIASGAPTLSLKGREGIAFDDA